MNALYKAVKVTDKVYWVGAIDWGVRDFHGYSTNRGSTYNAYLILADKITLVDTVKAPFTKELLSRISSVIEPEKIDYVVCNHAEMDHSGGLPEIIKTVKPEKVFASTMGVRALKEHFHDELEIITVKDGEKLSLGNMELQFIETRMLHWPDSMFTYMADDSMLFSSDAFGMHLASSERFDDELDDWEYEAAKYFANILLPYTSFITRLLDRVGKLELDIKTIAPDHGLIWRKDPNRIIGLYDKWARQEPTKKAIIVYDTMWQSTAMMANALSEGLSAGGAFVKVMNLGVSHRSDVVTELLDAGALLVGSPTLNNNMLPTVADMTTYLKGLRPQNKIGLSFGSYGWSGESVQHLNDVLNQMKVELVHDGLKTKYVPDERFLGQCFTAGLRIAERLEENI